MENRREEDHSDKSNFKNLLKTSYKTEKVATCADELQCSQ